MCESVPKNANLFLDLYYEKESLGAEDINLFLDENIYKNKKSIFSRYTGKKYIKKWLELFNKKLEEEVYDSKLKDLRKSVKSEFFLEAVRGKKAINSDEYTSKCISGKAIEGNLIIPISANEFITIEEKDEVTLRWYIDSSDCNLLEKFSKLEVLKKRLKEVLEL